MMSSNKIIPYEKIEVIEKIQQSETNVESIKYKLSRKQPSINVTFYLKEKPDSCYFADLWEKNDLENKIKNYLNEVEFSKQGVVNFYYGYSDNESIQRYFEPTECIENVE